MPYEKRTTAKSTPLPFIYQFTAGAIAGVSEVLVMYPLDVVKTRMQLQSNVAGKVHYTGLVDCLGKIVRQEGWKTLYRGITSPILMEAPKRATKFAFNEKFVNLYSQMFKTWNKQYICVVSGASAGVIEATVIVPFELVKVRMQDINSKFKSPLDALKRIVKQDGLLGMYGGLESTMLRHAFWNAGYFGIIYQVRNTLGTDKKSTWNDLIAGTIGGTMGCILNTPFDVVKSRVQSQHNVTKLANGQLVKKYDWAIPSVMKIYREEGFRALYKGFTPKIARLGPGGGILLIVFGAVTDLFQEMRLA
ncbi:hypothetical protein KAFR_0H02590 [Kazachstania africana CBS 2517]|uniref:Mitochondrial 2-oxodicarboxylate carrier 1 n=1 Tax=Kazachstania africana (strain ATCC 22294 / BCRC 22015 / CBS 2517 / CECT 1963 / NBRC 1671 / NRRL Y-8276) TaxID=1071382 RepID=H2AZB2_KAZAF|nr:hypothetical protein KAFR_0H02590 [Kazachstania africana CBS 2517]CCF59668.1 hypothetical protein KAFR_0H02590 [Kazachstania africana CBS 2517]